MALPLYEDPAKVNDATPRYEIGGTYYWAGSYFRYYKFVDSVTYAAGHCLEHASANGTAVSNDRSGGSSIGGTAPAGLCLRAVTEDNYGFVQVAGWNIVPVLTDGGVAAGDCLVCHTVDGQADTMGAGEEHKMWGVATAADDSSSYCAVGTVFIRRLL